MKEKFCVLYLGMSREDVRDIMGLPTSIRPDTIRGGDKDVYEGSGYEYYVSYDENNRTQDLYGFLDTGCDKRGK